LLNQPANNLDNDFMEVGGQPENNIMMPSTHEKNFMNFPYNGLAATTGLGNYGASTNLGGGTLGMN
jgi:hypothetical protein